MNTLSWGFFANYLQGPCFNLNLNTDWHLCWEVAGEYLPVFNLPYFRRGCYWGQALLHSDCHRSPHNAVPLTKTTRDAQGTHKGKAGSRVISSQRGCLLRKSGHAESVQQCTSASEHRSCEQFKGPLNQSKRHQSFHSLFCCSYTFTVYGYTFSSVYCMESFHSLVEELSAHSILVHF